MDQPEKTMPKVVKRLPKHEIKTENSEVAPAPLQNSAETSKAVPSKQLAVTSQSTEIREVKNPGASSNMKAGSTYSEKHIASAAVKPGNQSGPSENSIQPTVNSETAKTDASAESIALAQAETGLENKKASEVDTTRTSMNVVSKFKPSIILSMSAAPDLSGVNSLRDDKLGFNGGLLATLTLSPRLSLTTGAGLAEKIYGTSFSNYKPYTNYKFPVNPEYVNANCRVLDIPLNINYSFLKNAKSNFELSLGASSYLMLTEKYDYTYAGTYTKGPRSYQVRNLNQHYFSVGNLAIAYQRKLNANTSVSIQPYFKLPLAEIGYGNVKLLSTGVAFNLNMNLSTITGKK
jgi:hypothetical protein